MSAAGGKGAAYDATVRTDGQAHGPDPDSVAYLEDQARRLRAKVKQLQGFVAEAEKHLEQTEKAIDRAAKKG